MPRFPESGTSLVLDTSQFNSASKGVLADAAKIDKALNDLDGSVSLKVNVDSSEVGTTVAAVQDLKEDVRMKVGVDGAELRTAVRQRNTLDQDTSMKANADGSELSTIQDQLEVLRDLAVINIALNLPTNLNDIGESLKNAPVIGSLIAMDEAVASISARTKNEIPGAAAIIRDLYADNWGESYEEIGNVLLALDRAEVSLSDLQGAATTAFQTAALTGEDPLDLIQRMDTLVKNGLVPNFVEAGDFIAYAFENNLNRGGDFLDTIDEYSQIFTDARLSAGALMEIFTAGTAAGVRNTDKLADAYKEFLNLSREEVGRANQFGESTDRTVALDSLGLMDEATAYAAGELTGDQFSAGVLDALKAIEDPETQRVMALAIFSPTMVEDVGLPGLLAADLSNSSELKAAWQGAAQAGADIITNTLSGSFGELGRTLETELVTALDNAFDLTARLQTARQQIRDFATALSSGASLGEAIEIAFKVEGVDEFITRFEAGIGNFIIGILEVVASVQELTGKDSSGTRSEVARLAEGQLAFDLAVANPDEITRLITTALDRGVDESKINDLAQTAVASRLESDDVVGAQALVDAYKQLPGLILEYQNLVNPALSTTVEVPRVAGEAWDDYVERVRQAAATMDTLITDTSVSVPAIDASTAQAQVAAYQTEYIAQADAARAEINATLAKHGEETDFLPTVNPAVIEEVTASAMNLANIINTSFGSVSDGAVAMDETVTNALTGNTVTSSFNAVLMSAMMTFPLTTAFISGVTVAAEKFDMVTNAAVLRFNSNLTAMAEAAANAEPVVLHLLNAIEAKTLSLPETIGPILELLNSTLGNSANALAQMGMAGASAAGIPGRAGGGAVSAGQPYMVGERGPELIVPDASGMVLNNRQTAAMMSGGGTNITVNVNNNVQSNAQAANVGYGVAKAIRGMA